MKTNKSTKRRSAAVSAGPPAAHPKLRCRYGTPRLVLCTQPRSERFARRTTIPSFVVFTTLNCCLAQQPAGSLSDTNKCPPLANPTTQQNHRLMMELLGRRDLGTTEFPAVETALVDGEIAWRQHSGGHTTGPNWPTFLNWADRYIKSPAASKP